MGIKFSPTKMNIKLGVQTMPAKETIEIEENIDSTNLTSTPEIQVEDNFILITNKLAAAGTKLINENTLISFEISNNDLASIIGLTADKIKKGEVILGIEGTYEENE